MRQAPFQSVWGSPVQASGVIARADRHFV